MQPKTLSASSLLTWEECPAKFVAVNIERTPEFGKKNAADVGTTVHYALEHFVRAVYIDQTHTWTGVDASGQPAAGGLDYLLELLWAGYKDTFGNANKRSAEWKDALALTKTWYERTDLTGWTIDSVETKVRIPIGETGVLLTYIYDRAQRMVDEYGRRIVKIVDYKSERRTYSFDDLADKLQARIYAVAAAIQYRDWQPDEIWVELDMLRHTPIGREFPREENQDTWVYLLETTDLILRAEQAKVKRSVGAGCGYCPVKATCGPVQSNIAAGGILSLELDEMIELHAQLTGQMKAQANLVDELSARLLDHAERLGLDQFKAESGRPVKIKQGGRRDLTSTAEAAAIIGPDLMKMFGKLNMGDLDKLLESEQITAEQKKQLQRLIYRKPTKVSVEVGAVPAVKK